MPIQQRPVSRPAAWPGTRAPCSGTRFPSTFHPLPLSTDQVPDAAGYSIHTWRTQMRKEPDRQHRPCRHPHSGPCRSKPQARSLGGRPSTIPFGLRNMRSTPTKQSSCGPAAWPGTSTPYLGTRSPSTAAPPPPLIPKAAAHHWEWQHRSQPWACPSGGSRADPAPLPLHTRPAFRTRRGQQPTEGTFKRDGRGPARHIGRASPIIESGHIAVTHGGEASWPHSPAPYTSQRPSRPPASGATTPIHHHMGDTSGRRFRQGPPLKPQALRLGPWPMRKVRGSVANIEVGPWAPGHFYVS